VNAAKDGRLIEDSEMPVFHLMKELDRNVFETALRLRVDSTESTFSPSEERGMQEQTQQEPRGMLAVNATGPGQPVASDGAPWIWNQAASKGSCINQKMPGSYYMSEHVHAAKRVLFGEETEAGKALGRIIASHRAA
jgi:hypothetical protein